MNTLQTIDTRLDKKRQSVESDEKKIDSLNTQIAVYENSKSRIEDGLEAKRSELDKLVDLREEAVTLIRRNDVLGAELEEIHRHFDSFEWKPDMPWEHKIESSVENKTKIQERQMIDSRLKEIEKEANKIYYRR